MLDWYQVDEQGRLLYRRGLMEEPKGWGKSPLGGVVALAEFCGPVRFSHFDEQGEPVGRPWGMDGDPPAWVQVSACAEDQAVSNCTRSCGRCWRRTRDGRRGRSASTWAGRAST